jgi:hypothetical protein
MDSAQLVRATGPSSPQHYTGARWVVIVWLNSVMECKRNSSWCDVLMQG